MPALSDSKIKKALKKKGIDLKRAKYYERKLDAAKIFFHQLIGNQNYQVRASADFASLRDDYDYPPEHSIIGKAFSGAAGAALIARLAEFIDDCESDVTRSKSMIGPYIAAMTTAHPGPNYADPGATEINAFWALPITLARHGVDRITENFLRRLEDLCSRLRTDWKEIGHLFFPDHTLVQLSRIIITDSDSHKKGAHVCLLFFDGIPTPELGPQLPRGFLATLARGPRPNRLNSAKLEPLALVYKPGDLELDYRFVADIATIEDRIPAPQTPLPVTPHGSLLELLNTWAPNTDFLPRYLILPRYPGSLAVARGDGSMPIDESYGWIEFLTHEPERQEGTGAPLKKKLDGSKLDWKNCEEDQLDWITLNIADIDTFCQIYGWYVAIAITFSMNDAHAENVMVHRPKSRDGLLPPKPYLIDLEISFKSPTHTLGATMLDGAIIKPYNYLTSEPYYNQLYYLASRRRTPVSALRMDAGGATPNVPNRPYNLGHHPHYFTQIAQGFADACAAMNNHQAAVAAWFNDVGLQNTYARYTSEGTGIYWNLYRGLFGPDNCLRAGPPADTTGEQLPAAFYANAPYESFYSGRISTWDGQSRPNWATMTPEHGLADLINTDVPVFYHRINSNDLINARGFVVASPQPPLGVPGLPAAIGANPPPVPVGTWPAPVFFASLTTFRNRAAAYGPNYFLPAQVGGTFGLAQVNRINTPAFTVIEAATDAFIRNHLPNNT